MFASAVSSSMVIGTVGIASAAGISISGRPQAKAEEMKEAMKGGCNFSMNGANSPRRSVERVDKLQVLYQLLTSIKVPRHGANQAFSSWYLGNVEGRDVDPFR